MDSNKQKQLMLRLLVARMNILVKNPFYGLLLMGVDLGLDSSAPTAYACGNKICFSPTFLEKLSDDELTFVMHHEILHIVLKHCYRYVIKGENELLNIAADLVVDSTIYTAFDCDESKITIFGHVRNHLAPDGKEASLYTVEQVFLMLLNKVNVKQRNSVFFDDHTKWVQDSDPVQTEAEIDNRIISALNHAKTVKNNGGLEGNYQSSGGIPEFAERLYKELTQPKLDWRIILNNFIQEEINDYSFSPPDRRYDGDFFLPDFNGTQEKVKNILFVIDTSGSMSEEQITEMYSEIYGAINQFGGALHGFLGFFDAVITPPIEFVDIEEFKCIKPFGGGGTNFYCIFDYVFKNMQDNLPTAIIILTDGFAVFPKKEIARGIPVLWILNNEIAKPTFGKVVVLPKN